MKNKEILLGIHTVKGAEISLPNAKLIIAIAPKGYVMCGYLDVNAADKKNDCAAVVPGVSTLEELLSKKITKVSRKAVELGIRKGMSGKDALVKMF